jgi:NAD(P)-dependent dehydrogenase (short-subunit alcohol dehydrogenase family)
MSNLQLEKRRIKKQGGKEMKLQNKVAVVTGAASGMGKAIAQLFAKEGAKVVAADLNAEGLKAVVDEIVAAGGTAIAVPTNVMKEEEIENMINAAVKNYGRLDILINNAGIMDNFVTVGNLTNDLWNKVLSINLTAPMMASRLALNIMKEQETGGAIVNTASVGGLFGTRGGASYVAAKHGLVGLTKNIAATYGKLGIRCNAIAPGGVNTNIGASITAPDMLGLEALNKGAAAEHAPAGEPEEIAAVALFLASDDASFVNGITLVADGGWTAN